MAVLAYLLLGALLGGAVAWLLAHSRSAATAERARLLESDLSLTRTRLQEVEALKARIEADAAAEKARLEAQREADHQRLAEEGKRVQQYASDLEKMRTSLETQFQAVAARLLDEKSAAFKSQNKEQLDGLLAPLKQQLVDFRTRIDAVYKTESDDRVSLKAQIEQLRQLNVRITDEAQALTRALKGQAQVRGAWGELVLERLLEGCGLRKGEDYIVQESFTDAEGRRQRPDIILRLPDQRHLVVDSKVSLVEYERAANTSDPLLLDAARKAHALAVRRRVQELADKKYEDSGKIFSPEYVFMFVPIEPAFAMALETDPTLYDWSFDRRVILVTSSGLLAALRTVATIWKQDRQTRNVQEIARRGGLLYDKFVSLHAELEAVGQHLDRARTSYDGVVSKLKTGRGNLLSQVEELKALGAKAQKSLPANGSDDELAPPSSTS